jgi:hypothetical protein
MHVYHYDVPNTNDVVPEGFTVVTRAAILIPIICAILSFSPTAISAASSSEY